MKLMISILFSINFLLATVIEIPTDYPTIQEGIDASLDSDTILVQPGTYFENINFNGHNITLGSMFIMTGDTSYISQTVIDGNQNGSVISITYNGGPGTRISGFTITNGTGTLWQLDVWPEFWVNRGGGILVHHSDLSLDNVVITNNTPDGINISEYSGLAGATISINNARIINNEGDGISSKYSDLNISNSYVSNNSSKGIATELIHNITINNTIISNNQSGMQLTCNSLIVTDTVVKDNLEYGVRTSLIDDGYFNKLLVHGNGEGLIMAITNCLIENCTFTDNLTGVYIAMGSEIAMKNCIVWGNDDYQIYLHYHPWISNSTFQCSFSDIEYGIDGIPNVEENLVFWLDENIDTAPFFLDPENGDYHLQNDSPCIDAGDPESPLDPDSTISDMGAFYFNQNPCSDYEFICGDVNGDGAPDVLDIVLAVSIILEFEAPTQLQICSFDFNEDGLNDILDIVMGIGGGCWWPGE